MMVSTSTSKAGMLLRVESARISLREGFDQVAQNVVHVCQRRALHQSVQHAIQQHGVRQRPGARAIQVTAGMKHVTPTGASPKSRKLKMRRGVVAMLWASRVKGWQTAGDGLGASQSRRTAR